MPTKLHCTALHSRSSPVLCPIHHLHKTTAPIRWNERQLPTSLECISRRAGLSKESNQAREPSYAYAGRQTEDVRPEGSVVARAPSCDRISPSPLASQRLRSRPATAMARRPPPRSAARVCAPANWRSDVAYPYVWGRISLFPVRCHACAVPACQ